MRLQKKQCVCVFAHKETGAAAPLRTLSHFYLTLPYLYRTLPSLYWRKEQKKNVHLTTHLHIAQTICDLCMFFSQFFFFITDLNFLRARMTSNPFTVHKFMRDIKNNTHILILYSLCV